MHVRDVPPTLEEKEKRRTPPKKEEKKNSDTDERATLTQCGGTYTVGALK